jgi:hypothetical protein
MLTLTDRQEGHVPLDNTRTTCYPFGDLHSISSPRTISMRDRQCSAITSTDLVSSLEAGTGFKRVAHVNTISLRMKFDLAT